MGHRRLWRRAWDTTGYGGGYGAPQATAQGMERQGYGARHGTPQATAQGMRHHMGNHRLRRRAWDTTGYGAGHGTP